MTVEAYKKRMAELGVDREALETGLPEFSRASVRATKVSQYLPGGEARSVVPIKPPAGEPLDHLNPKWRTRPGKRK